MSHWCLGLASWVVLVGGMEDQPSNIVAYRGARILTGTDAVHPGTILISNGKISAVGRQDRVPIPQGAKVVELAGKVIIPGLVDTHSHIGIFGRPAVPGTADGNEATGPIQGIGRAVDAIYPLDPGIRMATAGGVTTANIMPGSGNVIGGQTIYVKLRGQTIDEMRLLPATVFGGLKMANGENPKRAYGPKGQAPLTRMKIAALQRTEFVRARDYLAKWDRFRRELATKPDAAAPETNLELEPLAEVLQHKRTVHFHSHRADDIRTVLRLRDEFDFELVVQHGTEGYLVADELARRKVPVSMTVVDCPGGKAEVLGLIEECGAELAKRGVTVLINTDDPITDSRFLLRTAAITVRGGLSRELALKAITLHAARALHLDERIGSLETGKDADFVVLSGEPFSVYSRVLATYIGGEKVFDATDEALRRYQTGGFLLSDSKLAPAPAPVPDQPAAASAPAMPNAAKQPNESSKELVVLAGLVHTVSQGSVADGVVHVKDGKIVHVGPRKDFELPAGVPVLTAAAVSPGFIDAFAVVPLSGILNAPADQDQDEKTGPVQPELRVLDAFNPREPLLGVLLENGITVVHACPGRANVIAGQTGVFRTSGRSVDAVTVRFPQALLVNLGGPPKEAYREKSQKPGTRMGTAALVRNAFTQAISYHRKLKSPKKDAVPEPNLGFDALGQALDRKVPVLFAAQRADDIVTALRLADEFQLRAQIGLASEAYLVADRLADAKAPVLLHPTMQPVTDLESINTYLGSAAHLASKQIPLAITSGYEPYVPKTRIVRHEAAIAMVNGMGFQAALRAVTLDAARILDIADRFGSLEAGKLADLVLFDGDPFEYTTHVQHVIVDGRVVFNRRDRQAVPFERRALLSISGPELPCCLGW